MNDEGGFLVKFDGKKSLRCYKIEFDYDEWQYIVNGTQKNELPPCVKNITVKVEG
jgi:hypothetical protein